MALTNAYSVISVVDNLLGGSSTLITEDGKLQAVNQALSELYLTFPVSDAFHCRWLAERSRRHMLYVLMVEQAHKFRVKQIHLNQRFENYIKMVEMADREFKLAVDANPTKFPLPVQELAITYIGAGFVYDQLGRDVSYQ